MPDQSAAATEHAILQEITAPLERLGDDPFELVPVEFPTALRGYDKPSVDDYVRQTNALIAELQSVRSPEAAVRRALERVGEQISGVLRRAHGTAEQITAQSRSEAEDRLQRVRDETAQMIGAAEQRVRDLDADADRIWSDRQRIMTDAEDLSTQLMAVVTEAGRRFPPDEEESERSQPTAVAPPDAAPVPRRTPPPGPEPVASEPPEFEPPAAEPPAAEPAPTESIAPRRVELQPDGASTRVIPPMSHAASRARHD